MNSYLTHLIDKQNLNRTQAAELAEAMITKSLSPVQTAAFLTALHTKGETPEEMLGFIDTLKKHMINMSAPPNTVDTCGTGGDGAGTFNISTAAALVVAGAGVPVAKHGNRAASSHCGSADVLEGLGARLDYSPKHAEEILKKLGFVFLFAPLYHPALKHVGPVRKELGVRTIFNLLGPFLNPALVKRQIVGVPNHKAVLLLKHVAAELKYTKLMIVSAEDSLDEISTSSLTHCITISGKTTQSSVIHPEKIGVKKSSRESIQGGNAAENAAIIRKILQGEMGPRRDVVLLNSAAALIVGGRAQTYRQGLQLAQESVDSGQAAKKLEIFIQLSHEYAKNS